MFCDSSYRWTKTMYFNLPMTFTPSMLTLTCTNMSPLWGVHLCKALCKPQLLPTQLLTTKEPSPFLYTRAVHIPCRCLSWESGRSFPETGSAWCIFHFSLLGEGSKTTGAISCQLCSLISGLFRIFFSGFRIDEKLSRKILSIPDVCVYLKGLAIWFIILSTEVM